MYLMTIWLPSSMKQFLQLGLMQTDILPQDEWNGLRFSEMPLGFSLFYVVKRTVADKDILFLV